MEAAGGAGAALIPVVILLAMEPHMSGIVLTVAVVGTILLLSGSGGVLTWAGAITAGTCWTSLLSMDLRIPIAKETGTAGRGSVEMD